MYLYCSSAATGRREEDPPFFFIRCSFATRRPLWLLVGSRQGTSSHYQNSYLDLAVWYCITVFVNSMKISANTETAMLSSRQPCRLFIFARFQSKTNQQNRKQQINICNRLAGRCRSNGRFIRGADNLGADKETALPSQSSFWLIWSNTIRSKPKYHRWWDRQAGLLTRGSFRSRRRCWQFVFAPPTLVVAEVTKGVDNLFYWCPSL